MRRRVLPTGATGAAVWFARIILIATFVGITIYGVYQMLQVVRFASMTFLQGLMIFFFGVSLAWIAFSAGSVLAGASKRRDPRPDPAAGGPAAGDTPPGLGETLTALVMPIYNEDPTRTTAALQAMGEALQKTGSSRAFEIVVLSDSTDADAWIRETAAVERLRRALAGIVPVWYRRALAQRRAQVGQHRGFRHALGRPLRSHDRARCRQSDRRGDPDAARADDACRSGPRHPADRSAAHRCPHIVRPAAAIRGLRLRTRHLARLGSLVRRQRKLLGPQRHHPRAGLRSELRAAGARRPQALRRPRAVARLRRGGVDAPRRMEGAHDHRLRRILGRVPALAHRRRGARPALGAGQSAAHENHRRERLQLSEPAAPRHRHHELPVLAAVAGHAVHRIRARRAVAPHPPRVFQSRLPDVSDLAAVQRRADDGAVLVQHGDTARAEVPRACCARSCRGACAAAAAASSACARAFCWRSCYRRCMRR